METTNISISEKNIKDTENLINFISDCPTAFHTVNTLVNKLKNNGYISLEKNTNIHPGGKYYIAKNMSSIIAFRIPKNKPTGFMICAAHSDSPCFKLKPVSETKALGAYAKLNVEKYGGMIHNTWTDRPLSVAGRVIISDENGIQIKLADLKRDFCIIPNTAIHMNTEINNGFKYNPQIDLQPIFDCAFDINNSNIQNPKTIKSEIANILNIEKDNIIDYDLFLYNTQKGTIFGSENKFFSAPKIDDLQCVYSAAEAFLTAGESTSSIPVLAVFDNEEVGSETKQGAASDFLTSVIEIINKSFDDTKFDSLRRKENSMMLSADNAHALHPNHPEKSDSDNHPLLNGGIVIKYNANQKYTTDSVSSGIFKKILQSKNIPYQVYTNRSDVPGGSTLGSIANTKFSIKTVDIGCPQLAMHSSFETAGTADTTFMIDGIRTFYQTDITASEDTVKISINN